MRATLELKEKRAWFGLEVGWSVICKIEFDERELEVIHYRRLKNQSVFSRGRDEADYTIADVLKWQGIRLSYPDFAQAKRDHEWIEQTILPRIKRMLSVADEPIEVAKVIEL